MKRSRRRQKLPGPVYRGEGADPRRRPRRRPIRRRPRGQGRRAHRPLAGRGAAAAEAMIGHTLVTKQTGPAGRAVAASMSRPAATSPANCTCPLLVDRATGAHHPGRLLRRRHGDRGGRARSTPEQDPARRDRSGLRHRRLPRAPPGVRAGAARQAGRARSATSSPACTPRSPRWTARSSRSIRWWSPARARWWRWMPRSASTTTRCSATPSWRSCATRPRKTRRSWKPPGTT